MEGIEDRHGSEPLGVLSTHAAEWALKRRLPSGMDLVSCNGVFFTTGWKIAPATHKRA